MRTEKELQDALHLARKSLDAAKWMRDRRIPRVDRLPHHVAVARADDHLVCCELAVIHHEWSKQP